MASLIKKSVNDVGATGENTSPCRYRNQPGATFSDRFAKIKKPPMKSTVGGSAMEAGVIPDALNCTAFGPKTSPKAVFWACFVSKTYFAPDTFGCS